MDDQEAFVRRHGPAVYRLAYARLHSRADADDIFQEVFYRYLRAAPAFESEDHAKAWLLRVTLNCCKDLWRAPWRKTEPLPEELPGRTEEETRLDEALSRLPAKYRTALHLHYYEGYGTEEIARLTGCRPSTVRSHLARGREKLREMLSGENGYEGEQAYE